MVPDARKVMKKLSKAIIAILVTAAGLIPIANPQKAIAFTKNYFEKVLDGYPAIQVLTKYGAEVIVKDSCKGDYYALFDNYGPTGYLFICADKSNSLADFEASLTHEAIHFAQWCWGGSTLYVHDLLREQAKKDGFSTEWADEATKEYKKGTLEYETEWEAYYMEDITPEELGDIVEEYCAPITQEEIDKI